MSILVRFTPRQAPRSSTTRRSTAFSGTEYPADGLEYHVCFLSDGKIRGSEIWESQEHLDAVVGRLMPVPTEMGIDPGQPEVLEIHNIIRR